MVMAHCHLRQVDGCGDVPRASQRQAKHRGDLETMPTIAAISLLSGEGSWDEALLRGMGCVPYYRK